MIVLGERKLACVNCVNGHRAKDCAHVERIKHGAVFVIEDRGRPVTNSYGNAIKIRVTSVTPSDETPKCVETKQFSFNCRDKCCKGSAKQKIIHLRSFVGVDHIENVGDLPNSERVYSDESQITSRAQRAHAIDPNPTSNKRSRSSPGKSLSKKTNSPNRISKYQKLTRDSRVTALRVAIKEVSDKEDDDSDGELVFPDFGGPLIRDPATVYPNSYEQLQCGPYAFNGIDLQQTFPSYNGPVETTEDIEQKMKEEYDKSRNSVRSYHESMMFHEILAPVIAQSSLAAEYESKNTLLQDKSSDTANFTYLTDESCFDEPNVSTSSTQDSSSSNWDSVRTKDEPTSNMAIFQEVLNNNEELMLSMEDLSIYGAHNKNNHVEPKVFDGFLFGQNGF